MQNRRDFLGRSLILLTAAGAPGATAASPKADSARGHYLVSITVGHSSGRRSSVAVQAMGQRRPNVENFRSATSPSAASPGANVTRSVAEREIGDCWDMGFLNLNNSDVLENFSEGATPFARLYIYVEGRETLAPLFLDDALTETVANPMIADEQGIFNLCYLIKGSYRIVVRSPDGRSILGESAVAVQSDMDTSFAKAFPSVSDLMSDEILAYRQARGRTSLQAEAFLYVNRGGFSYQIAPETASDHHLTTQGGLKLYVVPEVSGYNAVAFGADNTGRERCEEAFAKATDAARASGANVFVPAGLYRVERGLDFIGSPTISGFRMKTSILGSGSENTVFFSHGAPDYIMRINARYFNASGFSITGSIDEVRDTQHSAKSGLWIENLRSGAVTNFSIRHIVGAGLRIDRCIVSRIDGVVYRCGSDTAHAVDQTVADQDGCQASWVRINCEDAHGSAGAVRFLSHRNTHIEAKLENQPYWIFETSAPVGNAAREAAVSFSGGATGVVALTNTNPSNLINGNGQLTIKDLTGTVTVGETFTSSDGASGRVKAFTAANGPQFESSGEYGILDIFANQNKLRTTGSEIILSKANSHTHIRNLALRDVHYGVAVDVDGSDYTFARIYMTLGLTDVADHALYSHAMRISARNNHIGEFYSDNSKGVQIGPFAARCKIDSFVQENLYGQSALVEADDFTVSSVDCEHASYVDPGLDYTHVVHISGANCRFGTNGGRMAMGQTRSTSNVVSISGPGSALGPVNIETAGAAAIAVYMSGAGSRLDHTRATIATGKEGFRCAAVDGLIESPTVVGGAICIDLRATGARLIGGTLSGYSARAVNAQPGVALEAVRIQDVTCHSPSTNSASDITINGHVTYSHIVNNNIRRGNRILNVGTGVSNIVAGNLS